MKRIILPIIVVLGLMAALMAMPAAAYQRDDPEVEASIEAGIEWLVEQQYDVAGPWYGHWGRWERVAHTGLAVIKLEDRAYELGYDSPFDEDYPYSSNVIAGLDFILSKVTVMPIGPQPAGDPDSNGNGVGVWISDSYHQTYATGISLMALAGSRDPGRVVTTGAYAGKTYSDVVQDAVDYLAFGQNDSGWERGAWGYTHNQGFSDNSNSGYAVLGLDFAESDYYGFSATVPAFVKSELSIWIDWVQNDVNGDPNDGGSGYTDQWGWVNILKTGNLLYQMAFVGDTPEVQRVVDAVDYIERTWYANNPDPGFRPHHYQSMYCLMKGLERMGIDTIDVGGNPEYDWYDELSNIIVSTQYGDGSWPGDYWGGSQVLSAAWAMLTLEKVVPPSVIEVEIDIKPGSWPNSINLKQKGRTPVAILTTDDFDATTVDPDTVVFGPAEAAPVHYALEDVDDDGDIDMILHFMTQEIGLDAESTEATLTGQTYDEMDIVGTDAVRIVPPKGKGKK